MGVYIIDKWNDIDAKNRENIALSNFNLSSDGNLQSDHIVDCCKITLDKDKNIIFLYPILQQHIVAAPQN